MSVMRVFWAASAAVERRCGTLDDLNNGLCHGIEASATVAAQVELVVPWWGTVGGVVGGSVGDGDGLVLERRSGRLWRCGGGVPETVTGQCWRGEVVSRPNRPFVACQRTASESTVNRVWRRQWA